MVPVQNSDKAEDADIEKPRVGQYDLSPKAEEVEDQQVNVDGTQTPLLEAKATSSCAMSPPRRPLTRSQTGHVSKRRAGDDSPVRQGSTHSAMPQKRYKVTGARNRLEEDPEQTDEERAPETATPTPVSSRNSSDAPTQSESTFSNDNLTRLAFLNSHANGTDASSDIRRAPRSRAALPTPVPNLTKKSRGRRVPTKTSLDQNTSKEGRPYVCNVDGCGKCFFRGEHLKRHIRSIHTHEKPFKCTFPKCEKLFNRHDNLLQHLKVHREPEEGANQSPSYPSNDTDHENENYLSNEPDSCSSRASSVSPLASSHPNRPRSPYLPTTSTAYPIIRSPPSTSVFSYSSIPRYAGATASAPEPLQFSTNMAVSSIRTEIPPSPLLPSANTATSG